MNSKHTLVLLIIALFLSCEQSSTTSTTKKAIDTPIKDTTKKIVKSNQVFDTTGLSQAPVKILKTSLKSELIDTVDNPGDNLHHEGHFKRLVTIKIKYKNVSSKRIIGLLLNWVIVDKNGMPADIGSNKDGIGKGYMGTLTPTNLVEFSFGIGKSNTDEWQQNSSTGTKIKLAFPAKVEFYDNSIWEIGKK